MTLLNNNKATWKITPAMVNEKGTFFAPYSNPDPLPPESSITLDSSTLSYQLGWSYAPDDDFDVAYIITAVDQPAKRGLGFTHPACMFLITAAAAAQPQVQVVNYNNANCSYKDDNLGGKFLLG